jgi:A/G-specific adenine glycosylase
MCGVTNKEETKGWTRYTKEVKEADFQNLVWEKGRELYRDMPWRRDTRPYYVLVSELMLQQTQVDRVVPKFHEFIARFPDVATLARAPLSEVLQAWQGLGYNRRAKYLHEATKMAMNDFSGRLPDTAKELTQLPGVGANTAGALLAYAFNQPVVFIETNVRAVYFYHFFPDGEAVSDKELSPLIERTLDREHPREFYWALMDYGSWLKKQNAVAANQSRHYKKQGRLKGSVREVRGQIIRLLTQGDASLSSLRALLPADERFEPALHGLLRDGLISRTGTKFHLTR